MRNPFNTFASWRDASPDTDPSAPQFQDKAPQGASADAVVEMVNKSWEESRRWRRASECDWVLDLAFVRGHQYVEYNSQSAMLTRIPCCDWDDPVERYYYKTVNIIGRVCATVASQMTLNHPAALFVPRSASPLDQQAAAEERAIDAHLSVTLADQRTLWEAVEMAQATTTVFEYLWWDKDAEAEVPAGYGPDGTPTGFRSAKVGDVCRELLTFANIYPDPKCHDFDKAAWVVIDTVRSLDEVLDEYGKAAQGLQPDAFAGDADYLQSRLDWLNTERGGGPTDAARKNAVHLKTMWVRPGASRKYPKGAYVVVGGKRLLRFDPWPYQRKDWFFLSPLSFYKAHGTVWGLNNVSQARDLQMQYNQVYSNLYDQIRNDKTWISMEEGTHAGADAFTAGRNEELILHARGSVAPAINVRPPVNQHHWAGLAAIKTDIEDIMGGRDIGRGIAPSPDTSGVAVDRLQQANAVQIQQFKDGVDEFVRRRSEGRLELYRQYGTFAPRLLALSGEADPRQAQSDVAAFRAMRAGGRSRVTIQAGTALPRMPENVQQRIMDLAKMGMFAPENLAGTIPLLEALEVDGGDELAAKLRRELQAIQQQQAANQPNPAQVQQMKSQAAMQQQQMAQQHAAEMAAVQLHADQQIEQVKASIQAQLELHKAQLAMQQTILEKHLPSVSLAGKLGSQATVSAETEAGLEADDPGEIKAMNAPKPPAPGPKPPAPGPAGPRKAPRSSSSPR